MFKPYVNFKLIRIVPKNIIEAVIHGPTHRRWGGEYSITTVENCYRIDINGDYICH